MRIVLKCEFMFLVGFKTTVKARLNNDKGCFGHSQKL